MEGDEYRDGLLSISYTFNKKALFTKTSKDAILRMVDDIEIDSKKYWPQVVKEKIKAVRAAKFGQVQSCCNDAIQDYFTPLSALHLTVPRASHGLLPFSTIPRCPRGNHLCDATNIGWLMLVCNELQVLPFVVREQSSSPRRCLMDLVDSLQLMPSAPQVHGGSGVCDYAPAFRSAISDVYNSVSGLTLKDVSGHTGWTLNEDRISTPPDIVASPIRSAPNSLLSFNETVCLQVLSHIDDMNDLNSTAMVNRMFYSVYMRNEAALLKNVMKAHMRRQTTSKSDPGTHDRFGATQSSSRSDSYETVDTTPPQSPKSPDMTPMSKEEALKVMWPTSLDKPIRLAPSGRASEQNEKYLVADFYIEDKTRVEESGKHLRVERDVVLGLPASVDSAL
jgi:hypothetical protein